MESKLCAACGRRFNPRAQTPHQTYCRDPACQRVRKRKWMQAKLKRDPDYARNQVEAHQAWCERNPDYWREYRSAHPDYVEQNRQRQGERRARGTSQTVANIDVSNPATPAVTPPSGKYLMNPIVDSGVANIDAWTVELRVISRVRHASDRVAKR